MAKQLRQHGSCTSAGLRSLQAHSSTQPGRNYSLQVGSIVLWHTEVAWPRVELPTVLQLRAPSQTAQREAAAVAVYTQLSLLSLSLVFPTAPARGFVAVAWRVGILS